MITCATVVADLMIRDTVVDALNRPNSTMQSAAAPRLLTRTPSESHMVLYGHNLH